MAPLGGGFGLVAGGVVGSFVVVRVVGAADVAGAVARVLVGAAGVLLAARVVGAAGVVRVLAGVGRGFVVAGLRAGALAGFAAFTAGLAPTCT